MQSCKGFGVLMCSFPAVEIDSLFTIRLFFIRDV